MTTVNMDKVRLHMQCNIQEISDDEPARMCATCWRTAIHDLTTEELKALVKHYPPAYEAAQLWRAW